VVVAQTSTIALCATWWHQLHRFLSPHTPRQATMGPMPAWTPSPKTMKLFLSTENHLPPRTHWVSFRGPVHFMHRAPGKQPLVCHWCPCYPVRGGEKEVGLLILLTQPRPALGKCSECAVLPPPHLPRQVFFLVSIL